MGKAKPLLVEKKEQRKDSSHIEDVVKGKYDGINNRSS